MILPPLIALAGKARTGKNTVAAFVQAQYGGYQYAFASPIRAMLKAGFNLDLDDSYWAQRKEEPIPMLGKSPRQLMQTLGTEWGRNLVHPDLWLLLAQSAFGNRGPGMIITDMRFENEAAWIRRAGGTVVHVERNAAPTVNAHSSEGQLMRQPQDVVLYNDLDLESLQHAVSKLWGIP